MNRTSIRARLTALYAGLFALSGGALLAVIYLVMRSTMPQVLSVSLDGDTLAPSAASVVEWGSTTGPATPLNTDARDAIIAAAGQATSHALLRWSAVAFAVVLVLSVVVGWVVAGRALAPIHQMTATAARISARHLSERFRLDGPHDEVRALGDTFDEMLDRVEAAFDAERRLIATVSHELRTPLATQRAILEVGFEPASGTGEATQISAADAEAWRNAGLAALAQNERATRIIEAMLTLARVGEHVDAESLEQVDVGQVVDHAVQEFAQLAAAEHVEISTAIDPGVTALANRALTERLVDNLLTNAVTHNHPGGQVRVAAWQSGAQATLEVSNTGPSLTAQEAATLVLPFRRGGHDRTGSSRGHGLGLSIVAAIARAHGADLDIRPRPGGGLVVAVTWQDVAPQAALQACDDRRPGPA